MLTVRSLAAAAALTALATVSPAQEKRDLSKGNTLYAVPYSHLDTQWRWAYPQVIREYVWNTMHDNLSLIDKYPHYVFNFSGSRRYEMMREYYPEEYAKVVAAVKAGRWFPAGSSVDEGDANVPSGESIIRHVLYGNDWFRKNLGVASQEFMLPDCFGFPYALPTLLKHCGLDGFSTQKLTWGSPVGIPFKVGNWEGPDGQSIVAALDPGAYTGTVTEDLSQNTSWLARIQNTGKISGAYVDYHYYGTGDRGGAPGASNVEWVERSIAGKGPVTVVSTRADAMFTALTDAQKAKLPRYKGELLLTEHSAGSITSQAHMKRWNRKNELLADAAERASVAAALWAQTPYPQDRLYTAWDLTLGSQMHDMLPGTSLPKAYEFCYNDYLLAANGFSAVEADAVGSVVGQMDTRATGVPVVVYNPLSIAREDVVEAWVPLGKGRAVRVYGPDGKAVPTQTLVAEAGRSKVLFLAKLPPTGFATYDARASAQAEAPGSTLSASGRTLSSPRFAVQLNEAGDIASIYDKANKKESLKAPARMDFQYHNPSQFPAWNMDWADAQKPPYAKVDGPAKIRVVENGPVRATIEVECTAQGSKFVQRISLTAGGDRVEVANVIDWRTKESALKAAFPLTTSNPNATYDLQAGAIERGVNNPGRYEVPQHQWFDQTATDGKYGVAILNEDKFGSDKPSDDTVRLTLLYTPGVRGGYQDQGVQDFGRHETSYAIAPHAGDWRTGGVAWNAKRFNQPLRAFVTAPHEGRMGRSSSLLAVSSPQVEVQAVKRAEDGNGYIVRLRELTGKPASVRVGMPGVVAASEVDGQERPLGAKAKVEAGAILASVRGFGLKTYRVQIATTKIALPQPTSQPVPLKYDADVVSTNANDGDGGFAAGVSYPAEQFPKSLKLGGVGFKLGPTADGAMNALVARGQTLTIPKGYDRVYVLAAAREDARPTFKVGGKAFPAVIPTWTGYIGQWDLRLWGGEQPEQAFDWKLPFVGLAPGFVKKAEVAWYASHTHVAGKGNDPYRYCYMFKKGFDVPKGATTLTLPEDEDVRILAVSVAKGTPDATAPAAPLFDTLDDHKPSGLPTISVEKDPEGNGSVVTITPPLYGRTTDLRYTLGAEAGPGMAYDGPFVVSKPTRVVVAGAGGSVAQQVDASDAVAPRVTAAVVRSLGVANLAFSEAVDRASAESVDSYAVGAAKPTSVRLSADGRRASLVFAELPAQGALEVAAPGVMDMAGNKVAAAVAATDAGAVFTAPALEPSSPQTYPSEAPRGATDPWTLNLWLLVDKQPEDRTLIAGFGRATDGNAGTGRYLAKFGTGIQFWSAQKDVPTSVPLDVRKWQMLTATYDGTTVSVYKNGVRIGAVAQGLSRDSSAVHVLPVDAWDRKRKVEGEVQALTVWNQALPAQAVERLYAKGRG